MKKLSAEELRKVTGGKYYGNGVYCGKHKCRVDWGQAWGCSVNRWGAAVGTGGKATIGHC